MPRPASRVVGRGNRSDRGAGRLGLRHRGELLAAAADGGHTAIIKPWPLRPAVDGGFTLDDFTVDEAAGTVTCPNQLTRPITRSRWVTFGALCRGCPLRARCTTSIDRQKPQNRTPRRVTTIRTRSGHEMRSGRTEISSTPADGRTQHRVAYECQSQSPLPRRGQETTTGCTTAPRH